MCFSTRDPAHWPFPCPGWYTYSQYFPVLINIIRPFLLVSVCFWVRLWDKWAPYLRVPRILGYIHFAPPKCFAQFPSVETRILKTLLLLEQLSSMLWKSWSWHNYTNMESREYTRIHLLFVYQICSMPQTNSVCRFLFHLDRSSRFLLTGRPIIYQIMRREALRAYALTPVIRTFRAWLMVDGTHALGAFPGASSFFFILPQSEQSFADRELGFDSQNREVTSSFFLTCSLIECRSWT